MTGAKVRLRPYRPCDIPPNTRSADVTPEPKPKLDTLAIGCPLVQWRGEKGRCNWCNKELTGRQTRWCSLDCSEAYGDNHWWGYASKAAKRRDGYTCVRCGFVGWLDIPGSVLEVETWDREFDARAANLEDWAIALGTLDPRTEHWPYLEASRARREAIDELPPSVHDVVRREGVLGMGRSAPMHVRSAAMARRLHQLEVNHIVPCEGKHSRNGCWHHQDGLETLCRPCHLEVGREQRAARKLLR